MDDLGWLGPRLLRHLFTNPLHRGVVPASSDACKGRGQRGEPFPRLRRGQLLLPGLVAVVVLLAQIRIEPLRHLPAGPHLLPDERQQPSQESRIHLGRGGTGPPEILIGKFLEIAVPQRAPVLPVHPEQLVPVEAGVAPVDVGKVKPLDEVGNGQNLLVVSRGPTEQAEIVADGRGQIAGLLVEPEGRPLVPLAHLGAPAIQDQRDVGKLRRRGAQGLVEGDVLVGVGQVVFSPNHMRDPHLQVVDDIHEVKYRAAVLSLNHQIWLHGAVKSDFPADQILHHARGLGHFKLQRPAILVGLSGRF